MRAALFVWSQFAAASCVILAARSLHADESPSAASVTNVHSIRLLASQFPTASFDIHLEGDVWWANPAQQRLVFKDDSGVEELNFDWRGAPIQSGQRIILEGDATITPTAGGFRLGVVGPVVDNDGVHGMVEKSGSVFLKAGRAPLQVQWFNGLEKYGLAVEYKGPGVPRQEIPDYSLFRSNKGNDQGLDYICCAAMDEVLPDFNSLTPLSSGIVRHINLSILPRTEHIAVQFTGFLDLPRPGFYTFYTTSDDGSRLFIGHPALQAKVIGPALWPNPQPLVIGQPLPDNLAPSWAEVEGKVDFASAEPDGLKLELRSGTGKLRVEVANGSGLSPSLLLGCSIRATGFCESATTIDGHQVLGLLLVPGQNEITIIHQHFTVNLLTNGASLSTLDNAAEIHRLTREEAQREFPVRLRGVVTCFLPDHQAFTMQDATRGIYVIDYSESRPVAPRIGEYLEVLGVTEPGEFAPVVSARSVHSLGVGALPEPVHPTRDQLLNGSMDAQYVELQGVLTSVQNDSVVLLTPEGRIKSELRAPGLQTNDLPRYEDALVRVRGCLFATWDYRTHQVNVGQIRIYGAEIEVEQPAPADLFSTPRKTAADLFLFDPRASVFQRVKVSGQIIHAEGDNFYMMDASNGVRFVAKSSQKLAPGDTVEVVGFPELGNGSPLLREAVARKTGHTDLPKGRILSSGDLSRTDLDSTLVRLKAVLVDQRDTGDGSALEARAGLRSILAFLPKANEEIRSIPLGSQLELTGTYVSQNLGQSPGAFGLLLNSPSDITVLARPPWWTLEKLLVLFGALVCVLAFSGLWITQLRQKVDQRTDELEAQIRERERVEQQHAVERERARIARDLHDDLGAGLTEISMLGVRAQSDSAPPQAKGSYLEQMSGKAKQMVVALDELVWAMNPTHDSLESMVSYFSLYAERFLGLANIAWRLEESVGPVDYALDSRRRHQLFLAFKESLTNIVRHSKATEVRLNIKVENRRLFLLIADNGQGLADTNKTAEMDGVSNMRGRLEKLGGRFGLDSKPGHGMVVCFDLPLL